MSLLSWNYETNQIDHKFLDGESTLTTQSTFEHDTLYISDCDGVAQNVTSVIVQHFITNGTPTILSLGSHAEFLKMCENEKLKQLSDEKNSADIDNISNFTYSDFEYVHENNKTIFRQKNCSDSWQIEHHTVVISSSTI